MLSDTLYLMDSVFHSKTVGEGPDAEKVWGYYPVPEPFLTRGVRGSYDSYNVYRVCNPDLLPPGGRRYVVRARVRKTTAEAIGYRGRICCASAYEMAITSATVLEQDR